MKQAATRHLFSYWDGLRAGRETPMDGAPEHVRSALANTFLVEVDARRAYPLRVIGGTLGKLAVNARLGASFLECWEPGSRALVEAMLRIVHDERLPVVLGALACARGCSPVAAEGLLLPLAARADGKPRILGGLAPVVAFHAPPPGLALELISARTVRADRIADAAPLHRPDADLDAELAPSPPPSRGAPPRLRVIEGGRNPA